VGSILDDYPLDFSRAELRDLRDVLAQAFYRLGEIEDVVLAAGLSPGVVDWSGPPALQWRSILVAASKKQCLRDLLGAVGDAQPPLSRRIDELVGERPVLQPGTGPPDALSEPRGPGWKGFGAEKTIVAGAETLLGIAFLAVGVDRSRSVCRVTSTFDDGRAVHGTACRIGADLLLTNHHVLYDWDHGAVRADRVEAWFDYELDRAGTSVTPTILPCDAAGIRGDREHDWAVVRTRAPIPARFPVLRLDGARTPRQDDYVFIIQHPEGGPKMVGLSHNLVRYVDDDVLQYWTDTKSGSSGAPVFNARWEVVGLHHRWVDAPEGDGVAYRNQGRRIERVLAGLAADGIAVEGTP
jgi:hypothetical protein